MRAFSGWCEEAFDVIAQGKADAVALVSILHYSYIRHSRTTDADYVPEVNTEFLRRGATFLKIQDTPLNEIKADLIRHGIDCRPLTRRASQ